MHLDDRYEKVDGAGTANPLAADITRIYTETASQPGRMLNARRATAAIKLD